MDTTNLVSEAQHERFENVATSMIDCETCGTPTAQLITALYHLMGLGQDYHSPVSTCALCMEEAQEFRPHYQSQGFEWRLVPIN